MTTHSLILPPGKLFAVMNGYYDAYQNRQSLHGLLDAGLPFLPIGIPWALMLLHEKQCLRNHSQTVQRLHERGGLYADEAVAVLEDREHYSMDEAEAYKRLLEIVTAYLQENVHEDA